MDIVVIDFDGQIDDFPVLIQSVDSLIAEGTQRLVIDLEALPFINSAALSYLIAAQKDMGRRGGEIVLTRVQPAIRKILEMTELDTVFPAFETVEEALAYLGGDEGEAGNRDPPGIRRRSWR